MPYSRVGGPRREMSLDRGPLAVYKSAGWRGYLSLVRQRPTSGRIAPRPSRDRRPDLENRNLLHTKVGRTANRLGPAIVNCISHRIPRRVVRRSRQWSWLAAAISAFILGCGPSVDESGRQEVYIHVTEDGFVPRRLLVPADRPLTLIVTRDTDATCAKDMVVDGNDRLVNLPLNQAVRIPIEAGVHDSLNS